MSRTARRRVASAVAVLLAVPASGLVAGAQEQPRVVAGAAKQSITPFTVIPGVTGNVSPLSNPEASNPDGLPGGLWDAFLLEAAASPGQVTSTGIWGEHFEDENGNGRYDQGEPFTDDPVNTRLDPDSAGRWDGVYLAGYGNERVPLGAFDPVWARALYVRDPATGFAYAQVSIDTLGWFSDWNDRIVKLVAQMAPGLNLDHLLVSHTHNHEGPDTHVGLWGQTVAGAPVRDGTYPRYERYIEHKIAQAVVEAAQGAVPADVSFGSIRPGTAFTTPNGNVEDLEGLQSRNSCRTPWVFDDELRVVRLAGDGGTIGTLVNWGTHVESLDSRNRFLSSDFVHAVRETVETELGGVAVYVPGAQGAVEVIGDSCTRKWQRHVFDGETHPVDAGGDPIATKNADTDPIPARNRTYAIGRVAGAAAVAAAEAATADPAAVAIEDFTAQELFVPVNNGGLSALAAVGVIDKPAYVGGVSVSREVFGAAGTFASPTTGVDARTTVYAWRIGSASFVTAPGELAPELYLGLAEHNRTVAQDADGHFDYADPNPDALACAARPWSYDAPYGGDTGRPYEPGVRAAQEHRFGTSHNFLFGYTPDLLGYIVPGYDFAWYAAPPVDGQGLGALIGEAPDPCRPYAPDLEVPDAGYGSHYQETNSAGSMLAPAYTCTVWEMLGLDPASAPEGEAACEEWHGWRNAGVAHVGAEPALCDFEDAHDCVRHY